MASTIKVDKIEGSTGSTITVPTGQTFTVTDGVAVAGGGTGLTSYTTGDTVYASGATAISKLGIGTARQGLQTNSGASAPEWVDSPQSLMTAAGDVLYASGANTLAKLAKGSDTEVLTLASGVPSWAAPSAGGTPNFFVYLSGDQTISDQTLTKVTWDTEDFDSDSAFASNKFTVPSGAGGVYNFAVYYHTSGANRYMFCKVYKNGVLFAQNTGFDDNDDATGQTTSLSILMSLSATDYIETYIYTDTSGGGTVALKAADRASFFSGFKVA